ncbi:MAG: AtpZ/AtpI family protein [Kiritimatiellae bacterium]|nr:AtpZ/AtpI family protein [Kiritimatiellia bacterium]MCO5043986.1 AtpZ/AtpI family protein [Kiritimatiellia bacterium]MCO5060795.1 AtpZ/AtpI family protein [Kiritimatiellia bacterium]MCO5068815.1 AtpZ/AtpI family protein [Kiritimatiellia bacterium]MCO6399846.1 AtpZ/AtpI family protein [Verrucomicrobiota bacterium]
MSEHNTKPSPLAGVAAGFGLQLAVGMVVFAGGGYWLDRRRGGGIAFTLAGVGLGLFYIGYECWKLVRLLNEEPTKQTNDGQKRQ